jgi:16S rRNA U516 pseudouridylate synthase RsuA-like enzyme
MINRVSCGNARLGELGKGAWRGLNPGELRSLRKIAGLLSRGEKKTLGGAV